MTGPSKHYVVATTASFSHCPPLVNLCLALLSESPELTISMIIHSNNVDRTEELKGAYDGGIAQRLRLYPLGEKTSMSDSTGIYMTMVYKSGEAYGQILGAAMQDPDTPVPKTFIFDITSFFYPQVKAAVEANFPGLESPKLVAYNPEAAAEMIYHVGSEKSAASLQWVYEALKAHNPKSVQFDQEDLKAVMVANHGGPAISDEVKERREAAEKAYREVVVESDRVMTVPGYSPFHLYERWSTKVDWSSGHEIGWFNYLFGIQAAALAPAEFISCFPTSVLESEALTAAKQDEVLGQKEGYEEMGWFEVKAKEDWGNGTREFLDKQVEKSVVYISFGTIVAAGDGIHQLFEYLETEMIPFIYACGNQKSALPEQMKSMLDKAEKEGRAIVPDWCDQIGVLSHPSVMCFVSHCGANSTVESILAGVPIIAWGRHWDQILLSSQIHDKNLGVELIQQRSGHIVGRDILHRPGEVCTATPEARAKEIREAFDKIRGSEGEVMRANLKKMGEEIGEKRKGIWAENVKKFAETHD